MRLIFNVLHNIILCDACSWCLKKKGRSMITLNLEVLAIPLALAAGCIVGLGYYYIHTYSVSFLKVAKGALYSFFYPNKKTVILITCVRVVPCKDIIKLFKGTHIHVKDWYKKERNTNEICPTSLHKAKKTCTNF